MDQKTIPRIGLIGCGRIGSLWDEQTDTGYSKTHAKAYYKKTPQALQVCVDLSEDRALATAKKWNFANATTQLKKALEQPLDIISICTPVETRLDQLSLIHQMQPQAILLVEKPFAMDLPEGEKLLAILKNQRSVFLNYSRRFAPGIQELQKRILAGELGQLQAGHGYYGNGLLNNGSHMINLIDYLIPDIQSAHLMARTFDNRDSDPTLSFYLKTSLSKSVQIQGLDHQKMTVFELDLVFTKGRVRLSERGEKIEIFKIENDPVYAGFKIPVLKETFSGRLNDSMDQLICEAIGLFKGEKTTPSCQPQDSIKTLKLIEQIRSQYVS